MILLIGGSGQIGRRVASRLAGSHPVRALARTQESYRALRALGVEPFAGDLSSPETLQHLFDGVHRLFLLTPFSPFQLQQETNALDAAGLGLQRVVKIGAINRGIAIARAHEMVTRRLLSSGLEVSILRPDFFVSNVLAQVDSIAEGELVYPAGVARRTFVDPEDVAEVAAKELTTDAFVGGELILTGPESLTFSELADRISATLGHRVAYVDVPAGAWRAALMESGVPGFYADALTELFERDIKPFGSVEPRDTVQRVLGRPAQPVERFLREELLGLLARHTKGARARGGR